MGSTEWVRIPARNLGRRNPGFHNIHTSNTSRPRDGSGSEDEDSCEVKQVTNGIMKGSEKTDLEFEG